MDPEGSLEAIWWRRISPSDRQHSGAQLYAALATYVGCIHDVLTLCKLPCFSRFAASQRLSAQHSLPVQSLETTQATLTTTKPPLWLPSAMTDTNLARVLDLTRAVTDILNKGGAIGGLVGQVVKWLAREGIPEGEFAHCLEKSKALIYPNDNGLKIRSRIEESDAKMMTRPYIAGLRLVSALSIGRWMIDDPDYCYLVTTVAALFTQHDMPYATEVVCDMLLDEGDHDEANRKSYRYEKSRLLPVVKKIVESITLNVVNCSGNFDRIPVELLRICSHHIDSQIFAAAAMAISRSSGDVIIRCNRLLAGLYVWLLTHIEGEISVSIAGRIIHRATFGRSLRNVTMLADDACSEDHSEIASTLVVSVNVGGTLRTLLRHTASLPEGHGSLTNARQSLYDLKVFNRATRLDIILTSQEMRELRIAGQRIVRWLMARPATADHDSQIVYKTQLDASSRKPYPLTVGALLSQWPTILNIDYGAGTSGYSFQDPDHLDGGDRGGAATISIRQILNCFPHARTIIVHACRRCRCTCCREEVAMNGKDHKFLSKPGCLAYLVENHLCLILAHAVADGFGIPDASKLCDFSVLRNGVQRLMSEVISRKRIAWETWFSLAACTYLGCEWAGTTADAGEGSAELAAIQHGSAVVVAPWIDIRNDLVLQGSFGCSVATGQLLGMATDFGVLYTERTAPPAASDDNWEAALVLGIPTVRNPGPTDFGFPCTQRTAPPAVGDDGRETAQPHALEHNTSETNYTTAGHANVFGQRDTLQATGTTTRVRFIHSSATLYDSKISLQTAISGVSGSPFRLMIIAKAGDYLRIINPATVFMALARSVWTRCDHENSLENSLAQLHGQHTLRMWSVVDALGKWGDLNVGGIPHCPTYFAVIESDPTKLNILFVLSPHGCVVERDGCCYTCYQAEVNGSGWTSHNERIVLVMGKNPRAMSLVVRDTSPRGFPPNGR